MKSILVIAFPEFVRKLCLLIQDAEVHGLSFFEIAPPPDQYRALDQILPKLADYGWLIFTSQNAFAAFLSRLGRRGLGLPPRLKIAAVGKTTAEAVRHEGMEVALIPSETTAAGLIDALQRAKIGNEKILYLKGKESRPDLLKWFAQEEMRADVVTVYATRKVAIDRVAWKKKLADTKFDAVVITSPAQVGMTIETFGLEALHGQALIVLGRATAESLAAYALDSVVAPTASAGGLARYLQDR